MATKIFIETPSIISEFLSRVRNVNLQQDKHKMRRYMEMIGQFMGYEISKTLDYSELQVDTPMGSEGCDVISDDVVIASIMRAGLPMHHGLLEVFDKADSAFIGAYRKHHKDGTFEIESEYQSSVQLEGKVLILADAMLATGSSLKLALENLISEYGQPKAIHIAAIIAAQDGFNYIHRYHPDAHYWIGDMDEELTAKNYIVPGLGDAGDICFGEKS